MAERDRIATLDVLRGVAVLGILLVNVQYFAFTFPRASNWTWAGLDGPERLTRIFVGFFAEGKFITIFSVLFGMGLALQHHRTRRAGRPFAGLYARRLGVLFLFGLIHGTLFWYGDILALYAVIGFAALLCRSLAPRTLLILATCLFCAPCLGVGALALRNPNADWSERNWAEMLGVRDRAPAVYDGGSADSTSTAPASGPASQPHRAAVPRRRNLTARLARFLSNEARIYRSGTWTEMALHRTFVYLAVVSETHIPIYSWRTAAMFLLGMVLIRSGLFDDTPRRRDMYRRMVFVGLGVGVPLEAVSIFLQADGDRRAGVACVQFLCDWFGSFSLALAYLGGLGLVCLDATWLKRLRPVAAVGRMALTNYLSHTLICVFIFYSFGLGLFETISHPQALLLVPAIYLVQLILSPIWLHHFRFGPFEWVWRSLTYWRLQPFVRT
ncbi:MAG: DUF418 domain-containing protein [Phycisphaerae bacterium]